MQSFHKDQRAAAVVSHAKLEAKSQTILSSTGAARIFLTFGLVFNLCGAAILFVAASFNVHEDIRYYSRSTVFSHTLSDMYKTKARVKAIVTLATLECKMGLSYFE